MTARQCEFCHEDFCIAKSVLGKDFKCKGMKEVDGLISCTLSDDDLVDGCLLCERNEATETGYCKECEREMNKK
jgi:hypothetical protein